MEEKPLPTSRRRSSTLGSEKLSGKRLSGTRRDADRKGGGPRYELEDAHRALDEVVLAAYGWPEDLSDSEILERLLALNRDRAGA
jgi:hypothetical protein